MGIEFSTPREWAHSGDAECELRLELVRIHDASGMALSHVSEDDGLRYVRPGANQWLSQATTEGLSSGTEARESWQPEILNPPLDESGASAIPTEHETEQHTTVAEHMSKINEILEAAKAGPSAPSLDHAGEPPAETLDPEPPEESPTDEAEEPPSSTGEDAEHKGLTATEQAVQPEALEHEEPELEHEESELEKPEVEEPEVEPAEPQTEVLKDSTRLEGVMAPPTELHAPTDIMHEPVPVHLLDFREVPKSLFEDLMVEVFAGVLDGPFPGAGRFLKVVYDLISGPRFTPGRLVGFGPNGFRLQAGLTITPGGIVLEPGLDVQLPRPAKAQPEHVRWVEPWWVEASMPCAVAVVPRATIADVTKRRVVDAEAVVAFLETRLLKKAPPYAFIWRPPEARLALLGGKPAVGQPSCHTLIGVNPKTHVANVWTAVG